MATIGGALTALVTPFTADGTAVDLQRLVEQIEFQADGGVTGIVPCGTTGESPTLDPSEHRAVVETAVRQGRARGLMVVAGAGSNDTRHAVELHRLARDCGADAALHVCPYYNRPSPEGLYRHFMTVADACDLPVVLYNIPGRCGVGLTIRTIERLAAHPQVQAIKEASGSLALASRIVERTGLAVLSGDDPMTLPLMSLGAVGVVSVLSNLLPRAVASLVESVETGDLAEARSIHQRLAPIASALLELDSNPVPIKTALRLVGRDSGAVRLPLVPARQEAVETIEALLRSCPMLPALSADLTRYDAALTGIAGAGERSAIPTGMPMASPDASSSPPVLPYRVAVLCYLYDPDGRVLLLHRSRDPNAGMYSPIGGKLETTIGESPHDCAVREIREEAGVTLDREELHLTGIVAETAYDGAAHWLIFMFEVLRPVRPGEIARMQIDEGSLEWVRREDVADLPIPQTDRRIIWPLVHQHRGGFFTVHIDCTDGEHRWTVQESRLAPGRQPA